MPSTSGVSSERVKWQHWSPNESDVRFGKGAEQEQSFGPHANPALTVAGRLGHTGIAMLAKHYAVDRGDKEAAAAFGRL